MGDGRCTLVITSDGHWPQWSRMWCAPVRLARCPALCTFSRVLSCRSSRGTWCGHSIGYLSPGDTTGCPTIQHQTNTPHLCCECLKNNLCYLDICWYACVCVPPAGFFVCKLQKLRNGVREDGKEEEEGGEGSEGEEEAQGQEAGGVAGAEEEEPTLKVRAWWCFLFFRI